jgi:hypothetical protein
MKTSEQRPILCKVDGVSTDSLPMSLRHIDPGSALEDARALVLFLWDAFEVEKPSESSGNAGLLLVLNLIQDKLEIGMGRNKFPFISHKDDAPALVEREDD